MKRTPLALALTVLLARPSAAAEPDDSAAETAVKVGLYGGAVAFAGGMTTIIGTGVATSRDSPSAGAWGIGSLVFGALGVGFGATLLGGAFANDDALVTFLSLPAGLGMIALGAGNIALGISALDDGGDAGPRAAAAPVTARPHHAAPMVILGGTF